MGNRLAFFVVLALVLPPAFAGCGLMDRNPDTCAQYNGNCVVGSQPLRWISTPEQSGPRSTNASLLVGILANASLAVEFHSAAHELSVNKTTEPTCVVITPHRIHYLSACPKPFDSFAMDVHVKRTLLGGAQLVGSLTTSSSTESISTIGNWCGFADWKPCANDYLANASKC